MSEKKYKYDVFLSHNSKDKPAVQRFADRLRAVSIKPFLDVDELIPGADWMDELQTALKVSEITAVFISPHNISPWEDVEMKVALITQKQNPARRVIPVLLPSKYEPDIPAFLSLNTWVDFRETTIENDETFSRLLAGIWGIAPREAADRFATMADVLAPDETTPDPSTLPPRAPKGKHWHLPFAPNESFTGRAGELHQLGEILLADGTQSVVITQSITGMGGIGKTQLAVEFCYRYGAQFDGVYWLNAANPAAIETALYACGFSMGLYGADDAVPMDAGLQDVLASMAEGKTLIVLDNLETEQGLQTIRETLTAVGDLRLLLTARKQNWPKRLVPHSLPLRAFTPAEAYAYLRGELDAEQYPDPDLDDLGARLGHHPLALYLAMRYLLVHGLNIPTYLDKLANAVSDPSQKIEGWGAGISSPTGYDLNLHEAFNLSWHALTDETARTLFKLAAWCAPNAEIPKPLLLRALDTDDEATLGKSLTLLGQVGLLSQAKAEPTLHPLLCEYGQLLDEETHAYLGTMADALAVESVEKLNAGLPLDVAPYQAHLESLAPHAEKHHPPKAGTLWNNLGAYLKMIAGYAQAATYFRQALAIDRATFGEDHPNVATTLNNLGTALKAMGDLPAAVEHHNQALAIDRAAFGDDHPNVATDLNNLGLALKAIGDLPAAVEHYNQALAIMKADLGEEHPNVANTLNNLGLALQDIGDLPAAVEHINQALAIRRQIFDEEHPAVAESLNNLGRVLQAMGDLPAAVEHFNQALTIWKAVLGNDHPNVATTLNNLGFALKAMGDLPAAVEHVKQALAIDRATFDEDHLRIALRLNNLGRLLGDMGERETACAHLQQAVAIFEAKLPAGHPYIEGTKEAVANYGC